MSNLKHLHPIYVEMTNKVTRVSWRTCYKFPSHIYPGSAQDRSDIWLQSQTLANQCCMIQSNFLRPGETRDGLRWSKKLLLEQFSESGTNLMIDECYQKTISMRREIVISTDKSGPPSHALANKLTSTAPPSCSTTQERLRISWQPTGGGGGHIYIPKRLFRNCLL